MTRTTPPRIRARRNSAPYLCCCPECCALDPRRAELRRRDSAAIATSMRYYHGQRSQRV